MRGKCSSEKLHHPIILSESTVNLSYVYYATAIQTSRTAQVPMGRRCQERPEEDETHKMDRTSPRPPQMEGYC